VPGIDLLLSKYLTNEIKTQLKNSYLKKIEQDLFFIHGMSIKLSIEHFEILHKILMSFPEIDTKIFEKTCLGKIISLHKHNKDYSVRIIHPDLKNKILDYLGDPESRKLLTSVMEKNLTIPEILSSTKVLKSPAYRKIDNMILDGLILESGKIFSNNKRVSRYKSLFKEIHIVFGKNTIALDCTLSKNNLESSSIFKFGI